MNKDKINHLVVLDFLFQKFEVKFTGDYIMPYDVLNQIANQAFPFEKGTNISSPKIGNDIISLEEEDHTKLCLYRGRVKADDTNDTEIANQSTELAYVFWPIGADELDYNKFQFFVFRPSFNVFLTIKYNGNEEKIIFPIKKSIKYFKNYIRDKSPRLKLNNMKDFKLNYRDENFCPSKIIELTDNEFIQAHLNDKILEVSEKKGSSLSPYSVGRFYYFVYGQGTKWGKCNSNDNTSDNISDNTTRYDSLDFDDNISNGLTLAAAKKKLIEKHQGGQNMLDEKVVILFNGMIQTNKFKKLNDLLCDNEFYKFVVIFESPDVKIPSKIMQSSTGECDWEHDVPYYKNSRFLFIVNFDKDTSPRARPRYVMYLDRPSHRDLEKDIEESQYPISSNQMNTDTLEDNSNNNTFEDNNNNNNTLENNNNNNNNGERRNSAPARQDSDNDEEEGEEESIDESTLPKIESDEDLFDRFCYYFTEFMKLDLPKDMPPPSYFRNLSPDEAELLNLFTQYYDNFKRQLVQ